MLRTIVFPILTAIALIAFLTLILYARAAVPVSDTAKAPLPVLAATYKRQNTFERQSSYLGLVQAGRRTTLGFELPGLLAQLHVKEGASVAAGDVIATLDNAKLYSQRKATAANLRRVEIELERANIKAKRQRDLSNTGAVSREAYDDTRLIALALEAQVDAVREQLNGIDIDIQKSVLSAPYTGVIAQRYLDEGAVVSPGAAVVRLIETGSREAHIGVTVENIGLLQLGSQYTLTLRGNNLSASLLSIRPDVNPVTRTATAVFALPPDTTALDGEPISMDLAQTVYMEGGWLPIAALLDGQRGVWTVLRIEGDTGALVAVREAVEVMEVQGGMAFVHGTLNDGDRVVAHGVHRLIPGASITVVDQ